MIKLRSRFARLAGAGAGAALIVSGLAAAAPGIAHAQTREAQAPRVTPVSCAHEGNGFTGGPHVSGTKWTKQRDNCGSFWLIVAYNTTTTYQGYLYHPGIGWKPAAEGPFPCSAGSVCNKALATDVLPGTRLTVNSGNGGNAHIEVGY